MKKLSLSKETLKPLQAEEAQQLNGAAAATLYPCRSVDYCGTRWFSGCYTCGWC